MAKLSEEDWRFLDLALRQAKKGYDEGGIPVGTVFVEEGEVIAKGRNRRVQDSDPIAHGEIDAVRRAGRRISYAGTTLYSTLSPCMMCAGMIVQFGIPRVVVGEADNFPGKVRFLRDHGVELVVADDPRCKALLSRYIKENPQLWSEDIAED